MAIIDITWDGDPALSAQDKKDAGLELIRKTASRKPVIAFSQNFNEDFELVAKVREAGALPIQKNYTEGGHRILGAAIRLLGYPVQGPILTRGALEMTVVQLFKLLGNPHVANSGVLSLPSGLSSVGSLTSAQCLRRFSANSANIALSCPISPNKG